MQVQSEFCSLSYWNQRSLLSPQVFFFKVAENSICLTAESNKVAKVFKSQKVWHNKTLQFFYGPQLKSVDSLTYLLTHMHSQQTPGALLWVHSSPPHRTLNSLRPPTQEEKGKPKLPGGWGKRTAAVLMVHCNYIPTSIWFVLEHESLFSPY